MKNNNILQIRDRIRMGCKDDYYHFEHANIITDASGYSYQIVKYKDNLRRMVFPVNQ